MICHGDPRAWAAAYFSTAMLIVRKDCFDR
jgi:hypothetical protein